MQAGDAVELLTTAGKGQEKRSRITKMEKTYNDESAAMTKLGDNTGHYTAISYVGFRLNQLLREISDSFTSEFFTAQPVTNKWCAVGLLKPAACCGCWEL